MQQVTIADTPNYRLVSYGNGLSYSLTNKAVGYSDHFQGDDADRFRADFDAMEAADPERLTDDILRDLWEQYHFGAEPSAPGMR
jgi:hypothetical protein